MKDLIQRALTAKRESKYVDFKAGLDFSEPHAWCEIVKDMIAMANSGAGVLLIGLDNKGNPTGFDPTPVLDVDEAVVTDRIHKTIMAPRRTQSRQSHSGEPNLHIPVRC